MAALGFVLDDKLKDSLGVIVFDGHSQVDHRVPLRIVYPEGYPSLQPSVYTTDKVVMPSHHRPDSQEICLFGFAPNTRWSAEKTGADAITEADHIIAINQAPSLASGPTNLGSFQPPEPPVDVFHYQHNVFLIVPDNLVAVPAGRKGTIVFFLRREEPGTSGYRQGIVAEVNLTGEPLRRAQAEFTPWLSGDRKTATLFSVSETPRTHDQMLSLLFGCGVKRSPRMKGHQWFVLVFPETPGQKDAYSWVLIELHTNQAVFYRCFPFTRAIGTARVPGLEELQQKSVLMVGLGTLGSRVATHLAQAGVGKVLLYDFDYLAPGNLVRYDGDLLSVGYPKTTAVAQRLLRANPFTSIISEDIRVGWFAGRDGEHQFIQRLTSVDLVVESTGLHGVRRYLNELAYEAGVSAVYGWVTNGAWGAECVRVLPNQTPCYLCFRDTRQAQAVSSPGGLVFPAGCVHPTFTGAGFDTAEAGAAMARLAVQTLLRESGAYPDMAGHHLIWQARNEGGFFSPALSVYNFSHSPGCYVCGA